MSAKHIRVEKGQLTGDVIGEGWLLGMVVRVTICGQGKTFFARIRRVKWRHLKRDTNQLNMLEIEFFAPIQFSTQDSRTITFNTVRWSWDVDSINFLVVTQTEGERYMACLEYTHLDTPSE